MRYNQTSTEICLVAEYNTPLQVSVVTVNCAGRSEYVTINISIGMTNHNIDSYSCSFPQLAVVFPVHQSMAVLVSGPVPE